MHSSWLKAGAGQKLVALSHDRRPAWLWVPENDLPIWTNDSAQLASIAACDDVNCLHPIAGQVKRLLRLGTTNLPLKARIPFISGSRPDSLSCMCTPIELPNGNRALLMVAQKKIKKHQFAERDTLNPQTFAILPANVSYVIADSSDRILGGAGQALELAQQDNLVDAVSWDTETLENDIRLFILKSDHDLDSGDFSSDQGVVGVPAANFGVDARNHFEGFDDSDDSDEPETNRSKNSLSELITLIDSSSSLYEPLGPEDDELPPELAQMAQPPSSNFVPSPENAEQFAQNTDDDVTLDHRDAGDADNLVDENEPPEPPQVWRVMGTGPVKMEPAQTSIVQGAASGFTGFKTLSPNHVDATIFTGQGPQGAPISVKTSDGGDDLGAGQNSQQEITLEPGTQDSETQTPVNLVTENDGQDTDRDGLNDADDLDSVSDSKHLLDNENLSDHEDLADLEKLDGIAGIISDHELQDDKSSRDGDKPSQNSEAEDTKPNEDLSDAELSDGLTEIETFQTVSPDSIDQTARYNFDELSKILNARVNGSLSNGDSQTQGLVSDTVTHSDTKTGKSSESAINKPLPLDNDLILLNRLPVGVLIFRDQKVLFANRAFADMLACDSIADVRKLGLGRIFPQMVDSGDPAGPVLQLRNANDEAVWVDARLQSISFQGEPALVLTAHASTRDAQEPMPDESVAEKLAATFDVVSALANLRSEGIAQLDAAGVVDQINENGSQLIQHPHRSIIGRPLALFVRQSDAERLGDHLAHSQDDKTAANSNIESQVLPLDMIGGTKAYLITLQGRDGPAHLALLTKSERHEIAPPGGHDPALMQRLGRSIRRPLNTIMGFSQLIEGQTFGTIENDRYLDYARGILESGREIVGLIDELEDFSDIESGNFEPSGESFDLTAMLEECESVVRHQAGVRQVLVRSAIADDLPSIRGDRTTLRKAMLNVLASAIDQTSAGGKVILAAQLEDDGSIGVHVRDSGSPTDEWADRFAVFREQTGKGPEAMIPLKSSMGLALTRSLFAINSCELSLTPSSGTGSLMTLHIPQKLIVAG